MIQAKMKKRCFRIHTGRAKLKPDVGQKVKLVIIIQPPKADECPKYGNDASICRSTGRPVQRRNLEVSSHYRKWGKACTTTQLAQNKPSLAPVITGRFSAVIIIMYTGRC